MVQGRRNLGGNFGGEGEMPMVVTMSEEGEGWLTKGTLLRADDEPLLVHSAEDGTEVILMEFQSGAGDRNVIKVTEGKGLSLEDIIHQ